MSTNAVDILYQSLANLVEIIHRHGIVQVVLSPGSRSAPLAISFMRNEKFDVFHIVDERSAAYFALGLAKASGRPAALVCTSGTAAYNYAPAIAEAFFQEIPLLVLTSDRPEEWIAQNDNQAIFQQNIYGKHCLSFTQMPSDFSHSGASNYAMQKVNEACIACNGEKMGPVHLNFPFREPFYPENKEYTPTEDVRIIGLQQPEYQLSEYFLQDVQSVINASENIWLLAGMCQDAPSEFLLDEFAQKTGASLFLDPLSNLQVNGQYYFYDQWLKDVTLEKPDLVISFGNHFLSKSLKEFIRKNKPNNHLHIQPHSVLADPFGSVNFLVKCEPQDFFAQILEFEFDNGQDNLVLKQLDQKAGSLELDAEFLAAKNILENLPNNCVLHLGNSTPVRYLLKLGYLLKNKNIRVYANRGTSGIDGSVSTAIGMAQNAECQHFLIIGDLSMYYDRNGLWNNYVPHNFKIIVINNHGGGIFKRIEGSKNQPELQEYFVNAQESNFNALALAHGFTYIKLNNKINLAEELESNQKTLIEMEID